MHRYVVGWLGALLLLCPLGAQQTPPAGSRAEEIEAARRAKSSRLEPDVPPKPERVLNYIKEKRVVERITGGVGGIRVRLGGLATGQGFALGPEYIRRDLANEQITFRASAIASAKRAYIVDVETDMPRLANHRLFVNLYAAHRNLPQLQYYGPGPDSSLNGRSDYRLEDTDFTLRTGVRPFRPLQIGVHGGYTMVNVGPGSDRRFTNTDAVFGEVQAPGIREQGDFLRGGGFIQLDYRDHPGGPRRGGNYLLEYSKYSDRALRRFNFNRVAFEAQQYISFLNERRVIALRARADLTGAHRNNRVPFYLQPTVGGSNDLRGFRQWRFTGNNAMALNAEYRWEVFSGMDMAIFADAGKVFPRWEDLNFQDLEASYGFGMRFNVRNSVFLRIDTGFSHEGFQVWFKFNNVF